MNADTRQGIDYLDQINIIRIEFLLWSHEFMRAILCGEDEELACPNTFLQWSERMQNEVFIDKRLLNEQVARLGDIQALVELLVNNPSDTAAYNIFISLSEAFMNALILLEQECLLERNGIDPLTGLRSQSLIKPDIKKELVRYSRDGHALTIALMEIDEYPRIVEALSEDKLRWYIRAVADLFKHSLRSFDDGYRYKEGQFILSLKHAEMARGIIALERFREVLADKNLTVNLDGVDVPITLSCCVVEPLPDDDIDELLAGLALDLEGVSNKIGAVFEYYELSPLERYVKEVSRHNR